MKVKTKVYFNKWHEDTARPWTTIVRTGIFVIHHHSSTEKAARAVASDARRLGARR